MADGKAIQYTFLAPTSIAFTLAVPADTSDPFYYDNQLRRNVLLRHFVRRSLGKKEIEDVGLTKLTMADNTQFKLKHSGGKLIRNYNIQLQKYINGCFMCCLMIGEILINERVAIKMQESVPASKSVKIYVAGGLLTSHEEVSQAMSRNPNPGSNPRVSHSRNFLF